MAFSISKVNLLSVYKISSVKDANNRGLTFTSLYKNNKSCVFTREPGNVSN